MYFDKIIRIVDLLIIILFSPLFLLLFIIISILILIIENDKVFFYQVRQGKNNKKFNIIKFKTIYHKDDGSERISKLGNLLRRSSLDEIPQIINIIKNDMSFVGPRPLPLYNFDADLKKLLKKRSLILPGLTGFSQINYTGIKRTYKQKFELDIYYVKNRNLKLYFLIIFKTFLIIYFRFKKNIKGQTL